MICIYINMIINKRYLLFLIYIYVSIYILYKIIRDMIRETIEGRRSREDIQFGMCTKMVNALHAAWITGDPFLPFNIKVY